MKTARLTKPLTVAFSPEVYLKIKEITDQQKISMGEWVRTVVEKALSNEHPIEPEREGGVAKAQKAQTPAYLTRSKEV